DANTARSGRITSRSSCIHVGLRDHAVRYRAPAHRQGLSPAVGGGAAGARAALSRGHGEAQRLCRRDPEPLRRPTHDRRDRRRSRSGVRRDGARRRREGVRRVRAREELARARFRGGTPMSAVQADALEKPAVGPPLWLLCELTYRCPLHCVFCYNPVDMRATGPELSTDDWLRVLREARALGAVQLGLSGGEPLARDDLEQIVAEAHTLGYYVNLITSGIGLNEQRIRALKEAGLDHIQLSFQDSTREVNDFLSSTRTFELKAKVAALIKRYDYPMVLNVVLHRLNIDHVEQILDMADRLGAEYVELANTQYYGWAWKNREALLPTREQLQRAEAVTERFREKVGSRMRIFFVIPDYFERRPKACMNGLGSIFLT